MKIILFSVFIYSIFNYSLSYAKDEDFTVKKRTPQYGFFYGVFAGYQEELYKGIDNDVMAFPAIGYRGENLNILGPRISYRLYQQNQISLSAQLHYRFAGYDASDSRFFNGMEDRDATLDAGFSLAYKKNDWTNANSMVTDMLGRSNGLEISSQLGKTFYVGPIFIEPNIGLRYWDTNYVNYYYGVKASESTSGREEYKGGFALNKKLGINVSTPIFLGGFTRLSIEHTWFDSVISRSPLIESNSSFGVRLTFTRFF